MFSALPCSPLPALELVQAIHCTHFPLTKKVIDENYVSDLHKQTVRYFFKFTEAEVYTTSNGLRWWGGRGITLNYSCLGFGILAVLYALLLAFPGKQKVIWLVIGTIGLYLLNVVRIITILYLVRDIQFSSYIELSHDVFNLFCYVIVHSKIG